MTFEKTRIHFLSDPISHVNLHRTLFPNKLSNSISRCPIALFNSTLFRLEFVQKSLSLSLRLLAWDPSSRPSPRPSSMLSSSRSSSSSSSSTPISLSPDDKEPLSSYEKQIQKINKSWVLAFHTSWLLPWRLWWFSLSLSLTWKNLLGYLSLKRKNRKFRLENQMIRAIPFGKLQKTWAVSWGGAIFLLF